MAEPALSASSTPTTPAASTGGAASSTSPSVSHASSHPPSHLPPLLSRLSSPRAAPASVSAVNAVGVSGIGSSNGGAPTTSAAASLATRDESMLRVVRRADSVSTTTTTAVPSSSTATASTKSTETASAAASPSAAPTSSVSSVSLPVIGGPPLVAAAAAPLLPPATGAALAEPLGGGGGGTFPPGHAAGPASVATAPAALAPASTQRNHHRPQPPASLPHPPLQPSLPSASAQRHIAEARQALDASIANLLDTQLQSRAVLMHNNMRSIENQQRDLGKAVLGLRKANDGLAHLVHEMTGPLKEMGNMQNWTEVQFQGLSAIDETLRLVREKRERRERREKAAVEKEARREARKAARLEAGLPEDVEDGQESDGSSDGGTYWSSSYYSCSSRSRSRSQSRSGSRSRSRSRSRQGSPNRDKATTDAPFDRKGKGKAKMEDIVENVRAMPSSSKRKESIVKGKKEDVSSKEEEVPTVAFPSTTLADNDKNKEVEAAEATATAPSITNDDDDKPVSEEASPTEAQTEPQTEPQDTLAAPHVDTAGPEDAPALEEAEQSESILKEEVGKAQTAPTAPMEESPQAEETIEPTTDDQTEQAPARDASKERDTPAEKKEDEGLVDNGEDRSEQVVDTPALQNEPHMLDSGPGMKTDVTHTKEASLAEPDSRNTATTEPTIEDVVVTDKPTAIDETLALSASLLDKRDAPTISDHTAKADVETPEREPGEAYSTSLIDVESTQEAAEDIREEHVEKENVVTAKEADETSTSVVEGTSTAKDTNHLVDTHGERQETEQAEQSAAGPATEESHALAG